MVILEESQIMTVHFPGKNWIANKFQILITKKLTFKNIIDIKEEKLLENFQS